MTSSENAVVRSIIRQNEVLLKRHLILSSTVLDKLKSTGVIPDVIRRKMLMQPAGAQVSSLLDCVSNQGLLTFRKLLDVLRHTGHSWLVEQMLDTDVTVGHSEPDPPPPPPPPPAPALTAEDIRQKYSQQSPYTRSDVIRPRVHYDDSTITTNLGPRPGILRNSVTAGAGGGGVAYPSYRHDHMIDRPEGGLSLASLLRHRGEMIGQELEPRGVINARALLAAPLPGPGQLSFYGDMMPPSQQQLNVTRPVGYHERSQTTGGIPMSLYGLNQQFSQQSQQAQQALAILQQEEQAIRQLMEQNARHQGQVRRQQQAVADITDKLRDIHVRANDVLEPQPNPNIGRYRLNQLNQIPWSID